MQLDLNFTAPVMGSKGQVCQSQKEGAIEPGTTAVPSDTHLAEVMCLPCKCLHWQTELLCLINE